MLALRSSETVSLRILPHASYSTVHTASPLALCAAIGVRDVQVLSSGGIFSTCVDYSYKLIVDKILIFKERSSELSFQTTFVNIFFNSTPILAYSFHLHLRPFQNSSMHFYRNNAELKSQVSHEYYHYYLKKISLAPMA